MGVLLLNLTLDYRSEPASVCSFILVFNRLWQEKKKCSAGRNVFICHCNFFLKQKNKVGERLGIRWWNIFFLHDVLQPEGAYASRKDVGVNMVMSFINHEKHIKKRASPNPQCCVLNHQIHFGTQFSILSSELRKSWCLIPCLSPQEKKDNMLQKTDLIYCNFGVIECIQWAKSWK